MDQVEFVYWKKKEGAEGDYISGYGHKDGVPDYGEVKSEQLPTELEITHDEDGTLRVSSPPIIGTSTAYRYRAVVSREKLASIDIESEYSMSALFFTERVDAPQKFTTPENWWWYSKDRFHGLGYRQKTPVRLMKKWKGPMLEVLLADHPDKAKVLEQWDDRVKAHNTYVAERSSKKTPAHKRRHGDLVVLPFAVAFNRGGAKQVFRYDVEKRPLNRRDKHTLQIRSTTYTIRHGDTMTFKDGTAPCDEFLPPIKAVLPLLAWSEVRLDTAHAAIAAEGRFGALVLETRKALEGYLTETEDSLIKRRGEAHISGPLGALRDFYPRSPKPEDSPHKHRAIERLQAEIHKTLAILEETQKRLFPAPVEVE